MTIEWSARGRQVGQAVGMVDGWLRGASGGRGNRARSGRGGSPKLERRASSPELEKMTVVGGGEEGGHRGPRLPEL
jgi:hypothetical protein